MSHKATNWAIEQRGLKPAVKLVLWQLCDRHHPDHGCFPSQETLAYDCEISRASLNTHLKDLEARGLIKRIQRSDKTRRRQMSTLYKFAFEFDGQDVPETATDATADAAAKTQKPCPNSGHGAVSKKPRKPCPKKGKSRVQNLDTNSVKEPVRNLRACDADRFFTSDERSLARQVVEHVDAGGSIDVAQLPRRVCVCLVAQAMLPEATLERLGIAKRGAEKNGR